MSSADEMPPPATKGRAPDTAPDPNADRADDYPNKWRIERGKQTAKCMICSHSLARTKWCVVCENCNKRICSPCWEGTRLNRYGEAYFESKAQNDEGCWCRFSTKFDPRWQPAFDARAARMKVLIAAEAEAEADRARASEMDSPDMYTTEQPLPKRSKFEWDDSRDVAPAQSYIVSYERGTPLPQEPPAVDSVQQYTPEESPTRRQKITHLDRKTTVIIGAGIIGLTIAVELATLARDTGTNHEIIVVEKRGGYAEEASHDCAGLIYRKGVPAGYEGLLKLSLKSWTKFLKDGHHLLHREIRYKPSAVVHVEPKSTANRNNDTAVAPPSWYEAESQDTFMSHDGDVGKISTRSLAKYLYQVCKEEGVKFRFRQEVTNIEKTKKGKLISIDVARVGDPARFIELFCHNIIVAAGPGTPNALHEIVPWIEPRSTLANNKQYCDWIRIQGPPIETADKVGLVIRTRSERHPVTIATQHHEELLIASIRLKPKHVPSDDAETKKEHFSEAVMLAKDRLKDMDEMTNFTTGHNIVSTSVDKLPLVCRIPPTIIDDRSEGEDIGPLGIYLAYGFGMYGTTVSRGVAIAIRRMMMGQSSGIGEAFDYP